MKTKALLAALLAGILAFSAPEAFADEESAPEAFADEESAPEAFADEESAPEAFADDKKDKGSEEVDAYELLNLFGDVFEHVRSNHVQTPSDKKLIEAAIAGMLTSLDPHSSYLDAKRFEEMQVETRGEFGGLGVQITMEDGLVKVISPIDDTPAFRANIQPGDLISHLDGEPVLGLTLYEAVDKMRGPVGTDLRLTIRRNGLGPFDVTISRAIIKIKSVRFRIEDKVGYIRITSFNERTEDGVRKAMEEFNVELGRSLQGIVLDLRRNPGGLLIQAVAVSDLFLDKGEIVSTWSRREDDTERFNAHPGDLAKGLPVVVLIDGGSASASEVVAGALQDHRRAIILGTKSFGKGSVQTVTPIPGHGAVRLTTSRYYTPSGRSIQAVGIEPDIIIPPAKVEPFKQRFGRREADLKGALDNGNGEAEKNSAPEKEKKKNGPQDYQLERALGLIRGLSLYLGQDDD